MLKKLRLKLFTLFVLCTALTAISFTPTSSAATGVFCFDAPIGSGCPSYICCIDYDSDCWCV